MTDELNDLPEDKPKAARKTAAKKAVAKKAVAPKALEAIVPEPKAAEPKSTAKKAMKKAAKPASVAVEAPPPVMIPEPIPEPAPEPTPVAKKKAVAKKKSAKVTAEEIPAAPAPEPETELIPAPEPAPVPVASEDLPSAAETPKPKKKAARKTAAKQEDAPAAPEPVAAPVSTPPADAKPPAAAAASDAEGGEGEEDGDDEGDDNAGGTGTAVVAIIGADGRPSFPPGDPRAILGPIPHFGIGPDGVQRKLTKWERWKLRKERFKLIRQQKFQERQSGGGGRPDAQKGPGPQQNGTAPGQRPERGERFERQDRGDRNERFERQERPRPEPQLSPPEVVEGLLEISGKGFGFLRPRDKMYAQAPTDTFVTPEMVRQLGLREGVWIDGIMRRGPRGPQLMEITKVNGRDPDIYRTLPLFEELTAINPTKRYVMETEATKLTTRLIDYISPIGRGQRGLVVAPPRAGKTTFIQHIAEAVIEKYEEVKLILLLVDERPEEVTELTRALPKAEVYASNNDRDPREHIRMAHLAIERAKRLVEAGEHVFMVLDSITRLARASNQIIRGGKTGSGGVDSKALEIPRRMFAAARNTREAGSLTIIATALIETNSRADEVIFQEFKGTGNMELVLDRRIAQQYIYPAVDIFKSGTRREELLMPAHQLEKVHLIRRGLAGHKPNEAIERLIHIMGKFPTNAQMLIEIKSRE